MVSVSVSGGSTFQAAAPLLALSSLSPRPLRFFFILSLVSQFYPCMYLPTKCYPFIGTQCLELVLLGFRLLGISWRYGSVGSVFQHFAFAAYNVFFFKPFVFWLLSCGFCVSTGNMNLFRLIFYTFTCLVNVSYDLWLDEDIYIHEVYLIRSFDSFRPPFNVLLNLRSPSNLIWRLHALSRGSEPKNQKMGSHVIKILFFGKRNIWLIAWNNGQSPTHPKAKGDHINLVNWRYFRVNMFLL